MNKKKKIIIIASALGAALCIAVILLVYTLMGSKYRDIFFPNTVINGIDCSGLTAKEAEAMVKAVAELLFPFLPAEIDEGGGAHEGI